MKILLHHPYLLLVVGCVLAASGQIFLKNGATAASQWQDFINFRLLAGLLLYAIGTALWIIALTKIDLHIAYAFTALTFLMVYLGSIFILGEHIGIQSSIGAMLIAGGFFLIAASGLSGK